MAKREITHHLYSPAGGSIALMVWLRFVIAGFSQISPMPCGSQGPHLTHDSA